MRAQSYMTHIMFNPTRQKTRSWNIDARLSCCRLVQNNVRHSDVDVVCKKVEVCIYWCGLLHVLVSGDDEGRSSSPAVSYRNVLSLSLPQARYNCRALVVPFGQLRHSLQMCHSSPCIAPNPALYDTPNIELVWDLHMSYFLQRSGCSWSHSALAQCFGYSKSDSLLLWVH